jgi:ankyrin repeat protein
LWRIGPTSRLTRKGKQSWIALFRAASEGEEVMAKLLLESGANIEATNIAGWTTLYKSAVTGHEAIVKLLLGKGAGVEKKYGKGRTALYQAALKGHDSIVKLLIENGTSVETIDENGWKMIGKKPRGAGILWSSSWLEIMLKSRQRRERDGGKCPDQARALRMS